MHHIKFYIQHGVPEWNAERERCATTRERLKNFLLSKLKAKNSSLAVVYDRYTHLRSAYRMGISPSAEGDEGFTLDLTSLLKKA